MVLGSTARKALSEIASPWAVLDQFPNIESPHDSDELAGLELAFLLHPAELLLSFAAPHANSSLRLTLDCSAPESPPAAVFEPTDILAMPASGSCKTTHDS